MIFLMSKFIKLYKKLFMLNMETVELMQEKLVIRPKVSVKREERQNTVKKTELLEKKEIVKKVLFNHLFFNYFLPFFT